MWGTVNFSICGKHWSCLWKGGGGKTERRALFRDCYSKSQKMVCSQTYPYGKPWWRLDSTYQSFPGASAPRQSWRVWRSTSRYSVQLVLIARKATEPLHRRRQALESTCFYLHLPPLPHNLPRVSMENEARLRINFHWDDRFWNTNFPSINSGKWKSSG